VERLQESKVKKKALGLAAFLIVAASIVNAFFGERGLLGLIEANSNFVELEREVHAIESQNARLGREIHALRTDPAVIERRAREVLGMARPGEISVEIRQD
jgi:cell division protein FtsB